MPLFGAADDKPGPVPGFSVRQSSRAKRLSIKVFPRGRVEVVVPRRTSAKTVRAFVEENREWIGRARASFAKDFSPDAFQLPDVIHLPAIGQRTIVVYRPQAGMNTVRYRYGHGILTLSGNTGSESHCVEAMRRWLAGVARRRFDPMLLALSRLTGIPFERMHIRMQRTCWGSRSSTGTISLNLCLLFVPPALLRYLMIHEPVRAGLPPPGQVARRGLARRAGMARNLLRNNRLPEISNVYSYPWSRSSRRLITAALARAR